MIVSQIFQIIPHFYKMGCAESMSDTPIKPSADIRKGVQNHYSSDTYRIKDATGIKLNFESGKIGGRAFEAINLSSCAVYISDIVDRITITNCTHCTFALATIRNTIQVIDCDDCQFTAVCSQFRIRDSKNCDVFLHTKQKSIIEKSTSITFGCGNYSYRNIIEQMEMVHLDPYINMFHQVSDITPGLSKYQVKEGEKSSIPSLDGSCLLPFFYPPTDNFDSVDFNEGDWEKLTRNSLEDGIQLYNIRKSGRIITARYRENAKPQSSTISAQS